MTGSMNVCVGGETGRKRSKILQGQCAMGKTKEMNFVVQLWTLLPSVQVRSTIFYTAKVK